MPDTYNTVIAYNPNDLTIYYSVAAVDYNPTLAGAEGLPRLFSVITDKVEANNRDEAISRLKQQIPVPDKIGIKSRNLACTPVEVSFDGTVNLEIEDRTTICLGHDQIDPLIHALKLYRNCF